MGKSMGLSHFFGILLPKADRTFQREHAHRNEALYKFSRAIVEAGNDFNKITQVVALLTSEFIGDSSLVATLNPNGGPISTIAAFHHPSMVAQSLLRK